MSSGPPDSGSPDRRGAVVTALVGYAAILAVGLTAVAVLIGSAHLLVIGRELGQVGPFERLRGVLLYDCGGFAAAACAVASIRATVQGFFIPYAEPDSIEIPSDCAPKLRAAIDDLAAKLAVEPPRALALTYDGSSWLSIGMQSSGRRARCLYIGAPTLLVLTHAEFVAALAHELAHLGTRDGRLVCFVDRALERWCRYATLLAAKRQLGAAPLALISRRFIESLAWHSGALSRAEEYEADAAAARCTDAEAFARALAVLAIEVERSTDLLWPALRREAEAGESLPSSICDRWRVHLETAHDEQDRAHAAWLRLALHEQGGEGSSHPTLAQRIANLRTEVNLTKRPSDAPATELLGDDWRWLRERVDAFWRTATSERWESAAQSGRSQRARLQELTQESERRDLDTGERYEHALLLEAQGEEREAIDALRRLLHDRPDLDEPALELGRLLLRAGDARGLHLLDEIIQSDVVRRPIAAECALDFLIREGRFEEVPAYEAHIFAYSGPLDTGIASLDDFA